MIQADHINIIFSYSINSFIASKFRSLVLMIDFAPCHNHSRSICIDEPLGIIGFIKETRLCNFWPSLRSNLEQALDFPSII
jgi:hypothetical protein